MEKIIIVNEKDDILGYKERGTLNPEDIYRVSALWLINSKGDILLAQRSFNKNNDPGLWGPAVAGTNDENEDYASNMVKEMEEELGLTNLSIKQVFKNFKEGKHKHFTSWFVATFDQDISEFKIQEDEVEQIKWFPKEELKQEFQKFPEKFIVGLKEIFERFESLDNSTNI